MFPPGHIPRSLITEANVVRCDKYFYTKHVSN